MTSPGANVSVPASVERGTIASLLSLLFIAAVNVSGYPLLANLLIAFAVLAAGLTFLSRLCIDRVAILALPFVTYWFVSQMLSGTGPLMGEPLLPWLNVDGRLVVAFLPVVTLGCVVPRAADLEIVVRILRLATWANVGIYVAALGGAPGLGRAVRKVNYFGLTSSHHATGYIFSAALLVFLFRWLEFRKRGDLAAAVASLALVVLSGSRTSLVGLLFAFGWLAMTSGKLSSLLKIGGSLAAALAIGSVLVPRIGGTVAELSSGSFRSLAIDVFLRGTQQAQLTEYVALQGQELPGYLANILSRCWNWGTAFGMWSRSPFLGIGSGRINDANLEYHGIRGLASFAHGTPIPEGSTGAHNQFLNVLAENGLVGLGLMLLLWVGVYRILTRRQDLPGWQTTSARLMIPFAFGTAMTGNTLTSPSMTFVLLTWVTLVAIQPSAERVGELTSHPTTDSRRPTAPAGGHK